MTSRTSFTIHSGTRFAPLATIEVHGELDSASAAGFRAVMRDFVGDPDVTIDLAGCRFIDLAGIEALAGAIRGVCDGGGDARVVGASPKVRFALRAARAEELLAPAPCRVDAAV